MTTSDKKRRGETLARITHAELFTTSVLIKILSSDEFTQAEKDATEAAANTIRLLLESWKVSGRRRHTKPSRDALYLRQYRARLAVENAIELGASPERLSRLQAEFDDAKAEYDEWKVARRPSYVASDDLARVGNVTEQSGRTVSMMSIPKSGKRENADWVIDVTEACRRRGIENAYQLWQKIGGSKATSAQLFGGKSQMIRTETMNKLHRMVGIAPFEYILNLSDRDTN